jgi:hypothetical protein
MTRETLTIGAIAQLFATAAATPRPVTAMCVSNPDRSSLKING